MAEYIDREKALKFLENSLNFSKTELNTAHEEFQKGCISAIEDDIGNISHMPTEDVVPISEVEALIDERDRYKKYYFRHEYDQWEAEIKQEVAREIFEEVEDCYVEMLKEVDSTIEEAILEENHSVARTAKYGKDVMLLTLDTLRKMVKKKYIGE